MKRICTVFALCAVLLLTGCGSGLEQRWDEFTETVSEADGLSFTAALRAEYEDKSVSFELRYEQSGEECAVTVLSPEELRGVKAVGRLRRAEVLRLRHRHRDAGRRPDACRRAAVSGRRTARRLCRLLLARGRQHGSAAYP